MRRVNFNPLNYIGFGALVPWVLGGAAISFFSGVSIGLQKMDSRLFMIERYYKNKKEKTAEKAIAEKAVDVQLFVTWSQDGKTNTADFNAEAVIKPRAIEVQPVGKPEQNIQPPKPN